MAVNPIVANHLREARRELMTQLESLTHDIAQLDAMLGESAPAQGKAVEETVHHVGGRAPAPAMKDAVLDYLAIMEREVTTQEVGHVLQNRYGWSLSSTRSIMSKMAKAGEINNPRRGVYSSLNLYDPLVVAPTNTSDPDKSGSEDGFPANTQEGGEGDSPIGHHPDHSEA